MKNLVDILLSNQNIIEIANKSYLFEKINKYSYDIFVKESNVDNFCKDICKVISNKHNVKIIDSRKNNIFLSKICNIKMILFDNFDMTMTLKKKNENIRFRLYIEKKLDKHK